MLKTILNLKEIPKMLDASDGLAAAVCHYYQYNSTRSEKNYSSWKSFVKNNPKRSN
jgi:crossover junction endodeoxyribonuclease RuvC